MAEDNDLRNEIANKRKVKVVRRDISWEQDLISLPDGSWEDPTTYVKFLTPMIYMEAGVYVVVAWDILHDAPGVLIVNHSIFHQLRDWHRDFMQPLVDNVFQVELISERGLIYHRLTSMGSMPELHSARRERADEYVGGLFQDAWIPERETETTEEEVEEPER